MATPASGTFKQLAYKVEATYGTIPAATAPVGQLLRRTSSDLSLNKDTYSSNEIRVDFQSADFRHGVRRVAGKISGELSAGTYKDFMAAALKRDFAAVTAFASATITIAAPTLGVYPITATGVTLLTGGLKVGMVVRLTGALNAANSAKNLLVTDITSNTAFSAIVLNGSALVTEGPIAACTITPVGKVTYIPTTAGTHTDRSFSIEHYFADVSASETFSGCKIDKMAFSLPPTGMATIDFDVMGQNMTPAGAQYFTGATAVTTTGALAAVNGVVRVAGSTVAVLTGLTFEIDPGFTGDPVVGSNAVPFLFPGKVAVTGQFTAYFDSTTLRDAFLNETEIDLVGVLTADNTATADFLSVAFPRVKLGSAQKNDGDGGIVATVSFTALLNSAGGSGIKTEKTTVQIQDSQA